MFDADRPIFTSEQDRLGRAVFAKYLARCILDHENKESVVIGLYGSWGTGKTSIINLALEELRSAANNMFDDERPIILNFSAWSYSGQNQLIYSFFRRLSSEMRHFPYLENSEPIIHLLELYISFFTHKPVPVSLQPKQDFLQKILAPASNETAYGWESGRDLTQVKAELNALLSKQKHKFIIFIDNISRLEDQEIKQIFQIVKSMGDFVHTLYVLALDKNHIQQALNRIQGDGVDYLEKIIQLPFDVPSISKQDLEGILLDRLKKVFSLVSPETWDSHYWADIYYSTLKHFFENCRDITRYVNTLSFSLAHVKDVVNPVDFFALTALYVFEPNVYYGIRDNKDLFTDLIDTVYPFDQEKLAEDKLRCEEILNRAEKIPSDLLQKFLMRLFPRLHSIYQSSLTSENVKIYHSETLARKNRRICSPDMFDVYFRLSIPSGHIAESEMNTILALTHDEEGFALALLRLNQDDRIIKFLDLLDSTAIQKIPTRYVSHVINALMDSADLFPEGEESPLSFNTPMRIHRIFYQLLKRFDTHEKRFILFRDAITKATKSLYMMIHELTVQNQEHLENEDTYLPIEHCDFSLEHLQSLQKLTATKIMYWADIHRLAEHPKLLPILYAWKAWGKEEDYKKFVLNMIKEERGLLAFLGAALKTPIDQATTQLEKKPEWKKHLQTIEDFIPLNAVEPHAKLLFEDLSFEKLREREQLAILIFLDLIEAKTVKVIPKTLV